LKPAEATSAVRLPISQRLEESHVKLGTVVNLQVSPIKGFGINEVPILDLRSNGARGDRDFFVVDENARLLSATRTGVFLAYTAHWDPNERILAIRRDGIDVVSSRVVRATRLNAHFYADRACVGWSLEGPFDQWLSDTLGKRLHLIEAADPSGGVDYNSCTLVSQASLASLDIAEDVSVSRRARRFRLNVTLESTIDTPYIEENWSESAVLIGEATIRIAGRVPRCAAVQRDPETGASGTNVLKHIYEQRGRGLAGTLDLGVYADVIGPGLVRLGDTLRSIA
jgi:uncharacterized protein